MIRKILVLGSKGMLGNAVCKYFLKRNDVQLYAIDTERWPTDEFKKFVTKENHDFIINCIGAIPQKKNIFEINYSLPIWLCGLSKTKVIHPGTDCELDNDEYGLSKKKARDYIINNSNNTKIIKTSIIGHEVDTNYSLLDWFLNSKKTVSGFSKVYWNGNTTLQWAKFCILLINNWNLYQKENIIRTKCISKFELLGIIKDVYNHEIKIKIHSGFKNNKCLSGGDRMPNIKQQLIELKDFYSF